MKEIEKQMYYGANSEMFETARILRKNMTFCERLLWDRLKLNQIRGVRFRRQHPISFFIVDFYRHAARLVIELDGEIHKKQKAYDDGRSAEMEKFFLKIVRFQNEEVEKDIKKVLECIDNEVKNRMACLPSEY
jgi:very-short-patch-repair endonuclease